MLPLQRQALHTTIFDSICHNFRPAVLQDANHVQSLPQYKQVLLPSQRRALAVAALNVQKSVVALHAMMGSSHTRFAGIILPTFESAVLLVYLCLDQKFPGERHDSNPSSINADPLATGMVNLAQNEYMQAADEALGRLRKLAEVSDMAEVGARTLARVIGEATRSPGMAQVAEAWTSVQLPDHSTLDSLPDMFAVAASDVSDTSWGTLAMDFNGVSGL